MRQRTIALFVLLALTNLHLFAAKSDKTDIVTEGKSNYQIVIPDSKSRINNFIKKSALLLQKSIAEATGVKLPIVNEKNYTHNAPAIFVGPTRFANENGINYNQLKPWEYILKTVGNNLILIGRDQQSPRQSAQYTGFMLGSVKAVTTFLEQYIGTRFLLPGPNGIETTKRSDIAIPANLNERTVPFQLYNTSRSTEMFYDIANNFFNSDSAGIRLFGGHLYNVAVPTKKFFKINPELFALLGNRRYSGSYNHLCISHPETRKRIYDKILHELDKGYDVVELGQTDGYKHCECKSCQEKCEGKTPGYALWKYHLKLARRLQKDRPGKKIMIIAYGPTSEPPQGISEFPDNVMVELCNYDSKTLAMWAKVRIPAGFTTYIYNWGGYKPAGFTPHRNPEFCAEQAKLFKAANIKGVYKCGFGELFGLDGPVNYIYGKLQSNPNLEPLTLLDDFCKHAYGKAAGPMRNIFDSLYKKIDLYAQADQQGYTSRLPADRRALLTMMYTPSFLKRTEQNLERAKKMEPTGKINKRIKLIEADFKYVANLAKILHIYNAYNVKPTEEGFEQLAELIAERNRLIQSYYDKNNNMKQLPDWPGIRRFGNCKKGMLKVNGRMSAIINSPLTWDCDRLKKAGVLAGTNKKSLTIQEIEEPVSLDGLFTKGIWAQIKWQPIGGIQLQKISYPTNFKMAYDKNNLYVAIEAKLPKIKEFVPLGHDGPCWQDYCLEIFLDVTANRRQYYHFIYNPVADSFYDARNGFIEDPLDPGFGIDDPQWNGAWQYRNKLDKKSLTWYSLVTIPFKTLGLNKPPVPGTAWNMNIARMQKLSRFESEASLWSPNLEAISFGDKDAFGQLIFSGSKNEK